MTLGVYAVAVGVGAALAVWLAAALALDVWRALRWRRSPLMHAQHAIDRRRSGQRRARLERRVAARCVLLAGLWLAGLWLAAHV